MMTKDEEDLYLLDMARETVEQAGYLVFENQQDIVQYATYNCLVPEPPSPASIRDFEWELAELRRSCYAVPECVASILNELLPGWNK